jgi:hypothetical protein
VTIAGPLGWRGVDAVAGEFAVVSSSLKPEVEMGDFEDAGGPEPGVEMVGDFDAPRR